MSKNVEVELVRNSSGSINRQLSADKCAEAVNKLYDREYDIRNAVNYILEKDSSKPVTKDTLVFATLQELGTDPSEYTRAKKEIIEFLDAHTGRKEEGKPYCITRGPTGGIRRWANIP